jgi:hypothetical protein
MSTQKTGDIPITASFLRAISNEVKVSSIGEGEEGEAARSLSSRTVCDTMHELANSTGALLMNAQLLEWRRPPYSRLKRTVREIERHAQRSAALLKRLLLEFEINRAAQEVCGRVPGGQGTMAAVTGQGLKATEEGQAKLPAQEPSSFAPGPVFLAQRNSHRCVTPALAVFSRKRNDSREERRPFDAGSALRLRRRRKDTPRAHARCCCSHPAIL